MEQSVSPDWTGSFAEEAAEIAIGAARAARHLGHEPRVALLSHATFGDPLHAANAPMRDAVAILDQRKVYFEYDGEMSRMWRWSRRYVARHARSTIWLTEASIGMKILAVPLRSYS
jgi:phosphotransacetylase